MGIAYTALALTILCLAQEPAILIAAFCAFLITECKLEGFASVARSLLWKSALILIVAAFNCVFSSRGTTPLIDYAFIHVKVESLVFGLCMGLMLVNLTSLFKIAEQFSLVEDVLDKGRRRFPTLTLMLSTVFYLAPRFRMQLAEASEIEAACTAKKIDKRSHTRELIVLFSSAVEDAFVRAQSMRARGWSSEGTKTFFQVKKNSRRNIILTIVVGVLGLIALVCSTITMHSFSFYPAIKFDYAPILIIPIFVFFCLPFIGSFLDIRK